jgi:peptide deformylase
VENNSGELKFLPMGHPLLSRRAVPIELAQIGSPEMRRLYEELHEFAMGRTAKLGTTRPRRLVGVSANQVGINRAFVYVCVTEGGEWTDNLRLMVNPRYVRRWGYDEPTYFAHGCFSTEGFVTVQALPRFLEVEYYDVDGVLRNWVIDAQVDGTRQLHVVCHEIEHTYGFCHTDLAITQGQPWIFVVEPPEMPDFNKMVEAGRRDWPRRVSSEEYFEALAASRRQHNLTIESQWQ